MGKRTWTLLGVVAAALIVIGVVVALLWPRLGQAIAGPGPSASPTPTAVDPSKVSPEDLPDVPEVNEPAGAIKDATFGSCATEAGKREVSGKITSTAGATTDYVVTVSWVNDSSDVLARGVAVLKAVAPGESKEFTIKATVPQGVATCTFHVVRGKLS